MVCGSWDLPEQRLPLVMLNKKWSTCAFVIPCIWNTHQPFLKFIIQFGSCTRNLLISLTFKLKNKNKLTVFVVMLIGHPGCIGSCFRLEFEWLFVCHITVYNIWFGHHERNINSTRVSLVIVTGLHQSFSLEPDQTPSWCLLLALFFI